MLSQEKAGIHHQVYALGGSYYGFVFPVILGQEGVGEYPGGIDDC